MKEFLNRAIRQHQNGKTEDVKKFSERFKFISEYIVKTLGEKPFHLRSRLNTSALDSVFCTLLQYHDQLPNDLKDRYLRLTESSEFTEFTTIGTTDTSTVKQRFQLVKRYLIED